jgi:hypothetical protein
MVKEVKVYIFVTDITLNILMRTTLVPAFHTVMCISDYKWGLNW